MKKQITAKVNIHEIVFDEDLYPRASYNWNTSYDYSQSMLAGSVFPPIVLAILNHKKILVDGKHRLEAYKGLKIEQLNAIIYTGLSRQEIFKMAVQLNITHGRSLSPYEKRRIALKLMEMNVKKSDISKLILVPESKLTQFVGQRLISSVTGKPIETDIELTNAIKNNQAILKSGLKHLSGQQFEEAEFNEIQEDQEDYSMSSQFNLFSQVLNILKNNLLDKKNPKIIALVKDIKKLLKNY